MTNEVEDLAQKIADLQSQVTVLTRAAQLGNSSITQGGDTIDLTGALTDGADAAEAIPGLQDLLDSNEAAIAANKDAVAQAIADADQARTDGIAAGELASDAADAALAKAQEALDAALAAGGGATYTNRAPTSTDPGKDGEQWFVWDANYHVTAYYVYNGATNAWVATVLDDGTFGNLSAAHLTSGYIDAARIAAASLTAAVLAADTLTSREIGADAILARNIKALEITAAKIAAATITGDKLVADTITAREIMAGTITANEIAAGTITATQINLDSLNGKVITGATLRTAAPGSNTPRVEIYSNPADRGGVICFYSATDVLSLIMYATTNAPDARVPGEAVTGGGASFNDGDVYIGVGQVANKGSLIGNNAGNWHLRSDSALFGRIWTTDIRNPVNGKVIIEDTGWVYPTLAAGTNDGNDPFRVRRLNGVIYFGGLITPTTTGQTTVVLDAAYRPLASLGAYLNRGGTASTTGEWLVRVGAAGNVVLVGSGTLPGGSGAIDMAGFPPFPAGS